MEQQQLEEVDATSPTVSAQDVLRRMSLNSPPSMSDNPRQVKRAKLRVGGARGNGSNTPSSRRLAREPPTQTPLRTMPPSRGALAAPSPMPTWGSKGVNLRDASAGEVLEASDPSYHLPSFKLDCLREADDDDDRGHEGDGSSYSPASTTMDETEDDWSGDGDAFAPRSLIGGIRDATGVGPGSGISAALEAARGEDPVPETPMRRPGSGARARLQHRNSSDRARDHSCSPVAATDSVLEQGSPVKKRSSVGRWHLSGSELRGGSFHESPLRSNRNPFSPAAIEETTGGDESHSSASSHGQDDTKTMPAPAPRSKVPSGGGCANSSPMDTGDSTDFGAVSRLMDSNGGGNEGSFLRRVSAGSCVSISDTGGGLGKAPDNLSKPSPCDVTAFVPVTPFRDGCSRSTEAGSEEGVDVAMSPVSCAGRREDAVKRWSETRGRFISDFEELEVIGTGSFGTVYKVRSRVDGCLYAVKCSRRRFKGEADRQNMLREVYALAAVCDAQDTTNIVRYHQAWIEDERLYIQTELCETSLEKQLDKGMHMEVSGVYAFLRQTLLGLAILHQHNMVHLDIKPGNIFVKNGQYKLGDFGLVSPVHVKSGADVVEGDSRYMSKELLQDDHSNLTKCDVFSLGITLFEIISGRSLPPNGDEWQCLRSGNMRMPTGLPTELSQTLHQMMHPVPKRRPSAEELLRYPCLQSEMERQLNEQKFKLNKERTQNEALKMEVSALIQKQSQRSGRLSRTITWDNSYFLKSNPVGLFSQYGGSATSNTKGVGEATAGAPPLTGISSVGGTPPLSARATDGGRFKRSLFSPTTGRVFGSGVSAPRFGESEARSGASLAPRGVGLLRSVGQELTSLPEKEETDFERLPEA